MPPRLLQAQCTWCMWTPTPPPPPLTKGIPISVINGCSHSENYCPLHHVPVPLHKQADVDWPWPRCGIGCPWSSTNGVKSSNSCRMTTTLTPSSLHGGGTAYNITDLLTWFWLIIQLSMVPPVLQNTGYLNPGTPYHWVKSSIDFLKNLHPLSSMRLKRVSESLIHQNQLAWPSTCKGYGIRSWLRNNINIHSQNPLLLHKLESNTCWQPLHSCCWFIYAPVQGKILEVVDALNKTKFLVLGCGILIITVDHKPLQKVFDMIDFLMKSPMPACPTTKRRQYATNFTRHIFLLHYMRLPVLSPAILLA